jgi:DNA-binding NtrC family response regulator
MPDQGAAPIVIIEDDNDLRPEIVEYLERRKHHVIACDTLSAAREILEKAAQTASPPLAVISDVGLPDGDGIEFYVAFAPRLPSSHWILMSGAHDMDRLQRRLATLNGIRPPTIIEKPFSLRLLQQFIAAEPTRT